MLLDIGISGTDSLQVLCQSRKSNQLVPIVFITAAESKDLAIRSIGLGAQVYVLKPFGPKELEPVLDHWFARSIH